MFSKATTIVKIARLNWWRRCRIRATAGIQHWHRLLWVKWALRLRKGTFLHIFERPDVLPALSVNSWFPHHDPIESLKKWAVKNFLSTLENSGQVQHTLKTIAKSKGWLWMSRRTPYYYARGESPGKSLLQSINTNACSPYVNTFLELVYESQWIA
jgi:hypothetical protein